MLADYVSWLNNNPEELRPVELAALTHFRLVHIHPFVDGNGRIARLFMNLMLVRQEYPIAYVRREERGRYYDALERAHFGNQKPLVNFIGRSFHSQRPRKKLPLASDTGACLPGRGGSTLLSRGDAGMSEGKLCAATLKKWDG